MKKGCSICRREITGDLDEHICQVHPPRQYLSSDKVRYLSKASMDMQELMNFVFERRRFFLTNPGK